LGHFLATLDAGSHERIYVGPDKTDECFCYDMVG
jgi:hypothetical protein